MAIFHLHVTSSKPVRGFSTHEHIIVDSAPRCIADYITAACQGVRSSNIMQHTALKHCTIIRDGKALPKRRWSEFYNIIAIEFANHGQATIHINNPK